jgi:hypothetical protein
MATTDNIEAALAALALETNPNIAAIARQYNVNKTRLWRQFKGLTRLVVEAYEYQQLLSNTQLKVLVKHINHLSNLSIPPTISMVRVFAWEICQEWPSENWIAQFVLSHKNELQSAYLTGFNLARKQADNYELIKKYFDIVSKPNIN